MSQLIFFIDGFGVILNSLIDKLGIGLFAKFIFITDNKKCGYFDLMEWDFRGSR
jgi:hypothetical protein